MPSQLLNGPAQKKILDTISRRYLSPLRYPGGKRKLAQHISSALDRHKVEKVDRILEPFAGGAAVSISFLESDLADQAVLNDKDPLVAAFWSTVFSQRHKDLADRILDTNVTLSNWEKIRNSEPTNQTDMAFKCLFLNRTSFSGSLHISTGPIGGKKQSSAHAIDCRWNAEELASRIWQLGRLQNRVVVQNKDFRRFVGAFKSAHSRRESFCALWYFDPPFFHKAEKLYRFWFKSQDHAALKNCLDHLTENWILSYDSCIESREMYQEHPGRSAVDMRYTAARSSKVQKIDCTELLVEHIRTAPEQIPVNKKFQSSNDKQAEEAS